jgi:membrane associated rhomboid family serine protease
MADNIIQDAELKPSPLTQEIIQVTQNLENIPDVDFDKPKNCSDEAIVILDKFFHHCTPSLEKPHTVRFTSMMIVFLFNIFFSMLIYSYQICGDSTQVCDDALINIEWGGFQGQFAHTQWWRLLTYSIHHFTFYHILTNCICFYIYSYMMEVKYGTIRIMIIYFSSVIGGGLFSWWWYPPNDMIAGASAGVYGIQFLLIADLLINWRTIRFKWFTLLISSAGPVALIIDDIFNQTTVGVLAHLGGGLGSLWISFLILPNFYFENYEWTITMAGIILAPLEFIVLPVLLALYR